MTDNSKGQSTPDDKNGRTESRGLEFWMARIGLIGGLLGVFSVVITIYDRVTPPSAEVVGLVPVDVYLKTESKSYTITNHGISFVVRVQNGGRPISLGVLEIEGKVRLEISEYTGYMQYPEGTALEDVNKHYRQREPYRFISWVGWPSSEQLLRIEPYEERFLRYTVLEAKLAGETWARRSPPSDFIGFADGTKLPKWVDEFPEPRIFFVGAIGPVMARDVREEVKNGSVKIRLRVGSEMVEVPPSIIQSVRRVQTEEWNKTPVQDIYFGKNYLKSPADTIPYHE